MPVSRSLRVILNSLAIAGLCAIATACLAPYIGLGVREGFFAYAAIGLSRSQLAKLGLVAFVASLGARFALPIIPVRTCLGIAADRSRRAADTLRSIRFQWRGHGSGRAYRPDIDGLRAIAVSLVVGFHAFPDQVPGGFVGVDIFFVISGYLISSHIFENLDAGSFSFADFYYRRVRRIFPALSVVLLGVYAIGWWFLAPDEYARLGKHIASGAAFVANLVFWRESGYFDAGTKVLLHLWSLGVEEQFYIVWPLALWAAARVRINLFLMALAVAAASFLVNVHYVSHDGELVAAFFSPAARFWELMIGALLARLQVSSRGKLTLLRNVASLLGCYLVYVAVATITKSSAFPGYLALLPTIGAALVIAAGPTAWINRYALSWRLPVAIGLISYPLYLWHYPLLILARIDALGEPAMAIRIGIVAASVALAWMTYRCVEMPIRFGLVRRSIAAPALVAALLAIGTTGYATMRLAGLPFRSAAIELKHGALWHEAFFHYQMNHFHLCTPKSIREHSLALGWPARCIQSKPGERKDVAIIGDSHAEDLFIGMAESLPSLNFVNYIQGELPVLGSPAYSEIFNYVRSDKDIRVVILGAFWYGRVTELPKGESLETALDKTLDMLVRAGKIVYLIDDRPLFPFDPGLCKYSRRRLLFWKPRRAPRCTISRSVFDAQHRQYFPALAAAAAAHPGMVHLIDTGNTFCDARLCHFARGDTLMFRERNHLTVQGSRAVARHIIAQMTGDSRLPFLRLQTRKISRADTPSVIASTGQASVPWTDNLGRVSPVQR